MLLRLEGEVAGAPALRYSEYVEPAPEPQVQSGLVEFFNKGGNFMWWLLTVAVIGLVFIIERFITLSLGLCQNHANNSITSSGIEEHVLCPT